MGTGGSATVAGGSPATGGRVATSTGGALGTGGSSATCSGYPPGCFALCEGGICTCYCPPTGGASGTGGTTSTATLASGGASTGGSSSTPYGVNVCGTGCNASSTSQSLCILPQVTLLCSGALPSNLTTLMTANGCTDAGIDAMAFCCPPQMLTQCQ